MKTIQRIGVIVMAGAALAATSCSTGGRSPSGFLGNYKQLDAGYGTADAVASYVKPGVDLKKYDSVLIDPVTTVVGASGVSAAVKDQLAAYLGDSLRAQAVGKLKSVAVPGPTTIRVRVALTDVVEGRDSGNPVTTVHATPKARLTGTLGSAEVAAFVSSVSFEGEIQDSLTGDRLCALSDHRLGAKREATASTTWAAVRSATSQGAGRLWQRFAAARGQ